MHYGSGTDGTAAYVLGDAVCALARWQHFSCEMTSWLPSENMTSHQKSNSVNRCIFIWRTILPNFIWSDLKRWFFEENKMTIDKHLWGLNIINTDSSWGMQWAKWSKQLHQLCWLASLPAQRLHSLTHNKFSFQKCHWQCNFTCYYYLVAIHINVQNWAVGRANSKQDYRKDFDH